MTLRGARGWRCWFTAWVLGWAMTVYVASAAIAALGLSGAVPRPAGLGELLASTFRVADLVSPQAKLMPGLLLALGFGGVAAARLPVVGSLLLAIATALAATLATLAFLPAAWSRGFGIGLTGDRFDGATLPIYLAAAVMSGIGFALTHARCRGAAREKDEA